MPNARYAAASDLDREVIVTLKAVRAIRRVLCASNVTVYGAGCLVSIATSAVVGGQQTALLPADRGQAAHATAPAGRQTASVRGRVCDSAGAPVAYATVVWGEARQVITTTDSGSFQLTDIPAGRTRFTIRRIGYVPVDFELTLRPGLIKPIVVKLVPVASALSTVAVAGHDSDNDAYRSDRFRATGFFDRMARLPGYFITPQEVERRRPAYVSDLMYGVPGVTMVGRPHTPSLHYESSAQHCRLQLYLDGHPASDGDDFVTGSDIKAVEVYTSLLSASQKFLPSPLKGYCGSVVVWTK